MLVEIGYGNQTVEVGDWETLPSFWVDYVALITAEGKARFGRYDVYVWNRLNGIFSAFMVSKSYGSRLLVRPGLVPEHLGGMDDFDDVPGSKKFARQA